MATKREISDKIRILIAVSGTDRGELCDELGITPQSFANKLYRGSFTASELIDIVGMLGGTLTVKGDDWQLDLV